MYFRLQAHKSVFTVNNAEVPMCAKAAANVTHTGLQSNSLSKLAPALGARLSSSLCTNAFQSTSGVNVRQSNFNQMLSVHHPQLRLHCVVEGNTF